ncbi:MAG: hypothetical protein AABZ18_07205, partial [Pseudomonadota bacterium]
MISSFIEKEFTATTNIQPVETLLNQLLVSNILTFSGCFLPFYFIIANCMQRCHSFLEQLLSIGYSAEISFVVNIAPAVTDTDAIRKVNDKDY